MIVLAFDTSTASGSVAVRGEDGAVRQELLPEGRPASETLLPGIDRVLAGAGLRHGQVQALAVGTGPGTFTGLRVGLATAKGWAAASRLQVVGVPSFDALALPILLTAHPVLVAADARKGEVYAAAYRCLSAEGLPQRDGEVVLAGPAEAAARLSAWYPSGALLVGTAREMVIPFMSKDLVMVGPSDPHPRAWAVLELGERLLARGMGAEPHRLVPFYVRRPDAVLPHRTPPAGSGSA